MQKCERCQTRDARVRLDSGREQHYYCRQCAEELLGPMNNGIGNDQLGGMFGSLFNNPGMFGAMNGGPGMGAMGPGSAGRPGATATAQREPTKHSKTPIIDQYGRDLTQEARDGKLDPAAGRGREIKRVLTVLGRRQKNNPVLIGEPGVGKTAIVEGIARRIVEGNVPPTLREARIVAVSMGGVVAGAMFRGQFEERIKGIIEEARANPEIILFIDELHTVVGAGAAEGAVGASDLLKPALARGELRCIGATTLDEYRKHIEKDAALERRFQPVKVGEPSVEEAMEMLRTLRANYESHHGVSITDEAIEAAVKLSDRYINDRFLPDKAIDVMDEAASSLRLEAIEHGLLGPDAVRNLERELAQIQQEKEAAANAEDYERAAKLRQRELQAQQQLDQAREKAESVPTLMVTPEEIARVIENWTGVPVSQMVDAERVNLIHLENDLRQRVIGQDEAINAVARAIRRSRAGMKDPRRPIGSFLFMGPTGVGKTELARALAATIFGSEDAMIRLDMSEYMEGHTVSRLFGSPPGYVGHDEGGQLTERVRRRPYSVVLFDEIEKAHPEVFNALLQILDDGRLTDGQGRTVDFKNTVVIMTSNAATEDIRRANIGFMAPKWGDAETARDSEQARMRAKALEGLRRAFRPEFINRIDQIVVFHALGRDELRQIVDLLLDQSRERLTEQTVKLEFGDDLRDFLMKEGFDPEFGARPLRRAIQTTVDDTLADALLSGAVQPGQTAVLTVENGAVKVTATGEPIVRQPANPQLLTPSQA
ncbi:MAG TPA: ATP-dependent Clp protease ATP-binding subunit [Ktedonobacterales bacterium]|nr:ATP-dependent Clp protease ATP-binding subunit [Ktedonobacterales bacterium]